MGKVPVNPFALGAAFVERAVELGWIQVETDGRRSSYFLTDQGTEGLEGFGVNLEKAMQFVVLRERNSSRPMTRAHLAAVEGRGRRERRERRERPSKRQGKRTKKKRR